ncbi:hypothetical protein Hanom_Chr12g01065421 [Helianthus anomalus]
MTEEFYNTFYNAFTSESSETSTVTPKSISKAITENINLDNFFGTHSKPPKLDNIENYPWWKERFINWAKLMRMKAGFAWSLITIDLSTTKPKKFHSKAYPLKDKKNSYEQRMNIFVAFE